MREPRLSLHEKIPARHNVQVVKTCIHTQRVCENADFLRAGWTTGGRAKKVIVYYIIEKQFATSAERVFLHCLLLREHYEVCLSLLNIPLAF
jgi:hypothetical protein